MEERVKNIFFTLRVYIRMEEKMKQLFMKYAIEINDQQFMQFEKYYQLLIEWNQKVNLTTIVDYQEVIKKHFLDSCLLLSKYPNDLFRGKKIIDIGTGAGFPGIPLSIILRDSEFLLMDSLNKRIHFLSLVVEELGLDHVTVVHGRAEDFGRNEDFREKYDFCISRAVAALTILLEYCSPFVKKDGSLLLYKSVKVQEEIEEARNALKLLNCDIKQLTELADESDFQRYILEISKKEITPLKYPRRAGKPKKNPL